MTAREMFTIIESTVEEAKIILIANAPKRTMNLVRNIKTRRVGNGWELYVDESVYYMPYTNEPWVSPRWRGRANPNEAWFEEAFEMIVAMIAAKLGTVAVRS